MGDADLGALLDRMTAAAMAGDGAGFAACFTPDGIYRDYVYGDHEGRDAIAHMLTDQFHRDAADYAWRFFDPMARGDHGYAWSLSTFLSRVPAFAGRRVVIDGISRFRLSGGLIADYAESVNGCTAMAQLGVGPARMRKVAAKWAGGLLDRAETRTWLADLGVDPASVRTDVLESDRSAG